MKNILDNKKIVNAWCFYDWSNSVYSLVISSAIFPLFLPALIGDDKLVFLNKEFEAQGLMSYVVCFGFIIISILSPILSGIADYSGRKKSFLRFFCYLGSISTALLFFFDTNHLFISLIIYLLALIGFWSSLVFYNSYLPDISSKENQDKISAKGFSLGYIGSVILLVLCLVIIMKKELFGFSSDEDLLAMRYCFLLVGFWWFSFSHYTFKHLPKIETKKITKDIIFKGFDELKNVYQQLKRNIKLKRYLIAFFVYSMSVQTIMIIATYFGENEISWVSKEEKTLGLISSILIIQLIAILGAFIASKISSKVGNINTLIIINIVWFLICCYAYFVSTPLQFYITAAFVGFVMGSIQSMSRSTFSKFLPETNDTTSYFSFYDVTEKIGIIIGTLSYGLVGDLTGNYRNSIIFLGVFFIIGVILLFRVKIKK